MAHETLEEVCWGKSRKRKEAFSLLPQTLSCLDGMTWNDGRAEINRIGVLDGILELLKQPTLIQSSHETLTQLESGF